MNDIMQAFLADEIIFSPFYDHVLNFWKSSNEPNVLFLTYEQMKSDMLSVLQRTRKFLAKSLIEEQLEKLSRHLHVNTMRNNVSPNNTNFKDIVDKESRTKIISELIKC